VQHYHFSASFTTEVCGIDLNGTMTISGIDWIDASGLYLDPYESTTTYTNPLTGKSIVGVNAGGGKVSAAIDNGDGTISFIISQSGINKISVPDGPPLEIAAGDLIYELTFDAATGEFLSFQLLKGTAPESPPILDCSVVVPALT
jgi:hypothetical protein